MESHADIEKSSVITYYEEMKVIMTEVEEALELEEFFEDYRVFIDELIENVFLEISEVGFISYNVDTQGNGIFIYKLEKSMEIDQELIDRLNASPHLVEYIAVDQNIVVTCDYEFVYNPVIFLEIVQEYIAKYTKSE